MLMRKNEETIPHLLYSGRIYISLELFLFKFLVQFANIAIWPCVVILFVLFLFACVLFCFVLFDGMIYNNNPYFLTRHSPILWDFVSQILALLAFSNYELYCLTQENYQSLFGFLSELHPGNYPGYKTSDHKAHTVYSPFRNHSLVMLVVQCLQIFVSYIFLFL